MIGAALAWMVMMSPTARAQGCSAPVQVSALSTLLSSAERAYIAEDEAEFTRAREAAHVALPCLDAPLAPADAARWHRVNAFSVVARGGPGARDRAVSALATSLALDPSWSCPPELCAAGGTWDTLLTDARGLPLGAVRSLDLVACGVWIVDGVLANEQPADRATLVQLQSVDALGNTGELRWSAVLEPGQWAAPPPDALPLEASCRPPCAEQWSRSTTTRAAVGALGSVLVAGGAYALAAQSQSTFYDPTTQDERLHALWIRTDSLSAFSVVGASAGLGLAGWTAARGCLEKP